MLPFSPTQRLWTGDPFALDTAIFVLYTEKEEKLLCIVTVYRQPRTIYGKQQRSVACSAAQQLKEDKGSTTQPAEVSADCPVECVRSLLCEGALGGVEWYLIIASPFERAHSHCAGG